jgi:hypothetical protein
MPIFEFGVMCMIWSVGPPFLAYFILPALGVSRSLSKAILMPLSIHTLAWLIFVGLVAPVWYSIRKYQMEMRFKPYYTIPDSTEDALDTSIPSSRRLGWQMLSQ